MLVSLHQSQQLGGRGKPSASIIFHKEARPIESNTAAKSTKQITVGYWTVFQSPAQIENLIHTSSAWGEATLAAARADIAGCMNSI